MDEEEVVITKEIKDKRKLRKTLAVIVIGDSDDDEPVRSATKAPNSTRQNVQTNQQLTNTRNIRNKETTSTTSTVQHNNRNREISSATSTVLHANARNKETSSATSTFQHADTRNTRGKEASSTTGTVQHTNTRNKEAFSTTSTVLQANTRNTRNKEASSTTITGQHVSTRSATSSRGISIESSRKNPGKRTGTGTTTAPGFGQNKDPRLRSNIRLDVGVPMDVDVMPNGTGSAVSQPVAYISSEDESMSCVEGDISDNQTPMDIDEPPSSVITTKPSTSTCTSSGRSLRTSRITKTYVTTKPSTLTEQSLCTSGITKTYVTTKPSTEISLPTSVSTKPSSTSTTSASSSGKPHNCSECTKSFKTISGLDQHHKDKHTKESCARADAPLNIPVWPVKSCAPQPVVSTHTTVTKPVLEIEDLEYTWFYKGKNCWWRYDNKTSRELELAFKRENQSYMLLIDGFLYLIDFENMLQTCPKEPTRNRQIRRDTCRLSADGKDAEPENRAGLANPVGSGKNCVSQPVVSTCIRSTTKPVNPVGSAKKCMLVPTCNRTAQPVRPDSLGVSPGTSTTTKPALESEEIEYAWFYEGKNCWWRYNSIASKDVELAFKSGKRSHLLLIGGVVYLIDFESMTQMRREESGRCRRIKRATVHNLDAGGKCAQPQNHNGLVNPAGPRKNCTPRPTVPTCTSAAQTENLNGPVNPVRPGKNRTPQPIVPTCTSTAQTENLNGPVNPGKNRTPQPIVLTCTSTAQTENRIGPVRPKKNHTPQPIVPTCTSTAQTENLNGPVNPFRRRKKRTPQPIVPTCTSTAQTESVNGHVKPGKSFVPQNGFEIAGNATKRIKLGDSSRSSTCTPLSPHNSMPTPVIISATSDKKAAMKCAAQARNPFKPSLQVFPLPVGDIRPPVGDTRPSIGDIRPPVGDIRPPVGYIRPPVGDIRPSIGDIRPPAGYIRPPVGDITLSVGDIRPPVGDIIRPSVRYIRPPVGCIRPPVGYIRPPVGWIGTPFGCIGPSLGDIRLPVGYTKPPANVMEVPKQKQQPGATTARNGIAHFEASLDGSPSIAKLQTMRHIILIDIDNWQALFRSDLHLAPGTFVWGFQGGAGNWTPHKYCAFLQRLQQCFYLHPKCGASKDAADFALCVQAGKLDVLLPKNIPFTVLSGDTGFRELKNQLSLSKRETHIVNPHNKSLDTVLTLLNSIAER